MDRPVAYVDITLRTTPGLTATPTIIDDDRVQYVEVNHVMSSESKINAESDVVCDANGKCNAETNQMFDLLIN